MTAALSDSQHSSPSRRWNADRFWRPIISAIARYIWKPRYVGFDHIPDEGACLLIANHVSYLDGILIAAGCKRQVRFLIDGHIYNFPIVNYFMRHNGAIPILPNRESVSAALHAISEGLNRGDAICLFPEGKLTYTGGLSRFKPGIEWIIAQNQIDVYPIGIVGLWGSVFSRKYRKSFFRWWPRHWKKSIVLFCGEKISPDQIKVNYLQRRILQLKHEASKVANEKVK